MKMDVDQILGRIFIVVISLSFSFLACDFVSRYLMPHRRSEIEPRFPVGITRRAKPYVMFGGLENGELESGEILNRLGYRGKLPAATKKSDEFRVFMLGGSTVFVGNPPIPILVEKELRSRGFRNVEVYNFGVISSTSGMELSRILFEIFDMQPDLIVMYNWYNDISHPLGCDPRPGYPFNFIVYENNPLLESEIASYPTLAMLLYGSNICRYLFPSYFFRKFISLDKEREEVAYKSSKWRMQIVQSYVKNLVKANHISKSLGAEFIAFVQPIFYYSLSGEAESRVLPETMEYYIDMRDRLFAEVKEAEDDSSIRVIDLTSIYGDGSEWEFSDECHTVQKAKPIVAQKIAREIISNVLSKQVPISPN